MPHYTLEYGGGLGDVFYQMYLHGSYNCLSALHPHDTATVTLITHNPHTRELFDFHPNRDRIDVRDLGYWAPEEDAVKRKEHGLGPPGANGRLPRYPARFEFHPAPADAPALALTHGTGYVVLAPGAGLPDRNIPDDILESAIEVLLPRYDLVVVGRNYDRHGRFEPDVIGRSAPVIERCAAEQGRRLINLVDQLSVPGVACVVRRSLGVVTAHSALNILAWLEERPQLLLYPESVEVNHIRRRDQWAFGIDWPITTHARFDRYSEKLAEHFAETLV